MTTVYVQSGTFSWDFNDQSSELTGVLLSLPGKHVIVGDFNFRINEPTDVNAAKFKALIEQFNLIQHVNLSTHVAGNTLDLILTCDDVSVTHIHTDHSVNSDRCAVLFHLWCVSPGTVRKSITYRKWKAVDIASVQSDISGAFIDFSHHDLSSAIGFYNDTLADIVEKHTPEKSRVVTVRADKPWYTAELSAEKRLRRNCERKYRNTQLESVTVEGAAE